jgi:3-oxoacyl-(acyl-carrier-protein) synthase
MLNPHTTKATDNKRFIFFTSLLLCQSDAMTYKSIQMEIMVTSWARVLPGAAGPDPTRMRQRKSLKVMDQGTRCLLRAAIEALALAQLPDPIGPTCGICLGVDGGDLGAHALQHIQGTAHPGTSPTDSWMEHLTPLWMLEWLPHMPASHLAIQAGAGGPCHTFSSPGPLIREALSLTFDWIQQGEADLALASSLHHGHEAVVMVVERGAHARARGAGPCAPLPEDLASCLPT